jgi:intracellular multiplication protein IcmJ
MSLLLGIKRPSPKGAAATSSKRPAAKVTMQQWPQLRDAVLQRDNFTCTYCGFRAKKFQRVHFRGGEPADLHVDNLATACIFCEQCCELESVPRMHSGQIIWLPELAQTDLHHLMRALFVARMQEDHDISKTAQRIMEQLLSRRTELRKRLGTDDVNVLATAMAETMDDKTYARRGAMLDGVRLMPLPRRMAGDTDQFDTIIRYWMSLEGPFMAGTPKEWLRLAEKIAA